MKQQQKRTNQVILFCCPSLSAPPSCICACGFRLLSQCAFSLAKQRNGASLLSCRNPAFPGAQRKTKQNAGKLYSGGRLVSARRRGVTYLAPSTLYMLGGKIENVQAKNKTASSSGPTTKKTKRSKTRNRKQKPENFHKEKKRQMMYRQNHGAMLFCRRISAIYHIPN